MLDSGDNPSRQNQWGVFCVRHHYKSILTKIKFKKKIKKKFSAKFTCCYVHFSILLAL